MPADKTRPVGAQPPGWRYRSAAETSRPGYLQERFKELQKKLLGKEVCNGKR